MTKATITFLGHTTVLINMDGILFIIDPNFSKKISLLKRLDDNLINIDTDKLHQIQVILLTNAHRNRFDTGSFRFFKQTAQVILPLGSSKFLGKYYRFHKNELKAGAETKIGNCQIIALKSLHRGFRTCSALKTNSLNYMLKTPDQTIFYCSDTRYDGAYFYDIGREYNIDLAILPVDHVGIDALAKNRFMNTSQALQAFRDLNAKKMLPVAFGSFNFAQRKAAKVIENIKAEMLKQNLGDEVCILDRGESLTI